MKEKRLNTILTLLFWVIGSFSLWEFVYELSHMIGGIVCNDLGYAISETLRMLPLTLTMISCIIFGALLLFSYTAKDIETRIRNWKIMSIFAFILGSAIIIYIIIGLITGRYASLVEGYPSLLFPLDVLICGILIVYYGYYAGKYVIKLQSDGSELPYTVCRFNGFLRGIARFFCFFSYLFASAAFAGCIYGLYVMDWRHGGIFYNILLWLNFFVSFGMFFVYRFVYVEMKNESKVKALRKFSLSFLIINVVLFASFILAVQFDPEAPARNAFGLLPIDFIASVNVFPLIYGPNNILVPIGAFVYSLLAEKNDKSQQQ